MRDIAIFGAGGLGKEVACLINRINSAYDDAKDRWQLIGFFDNEVKKGTQISHFGKVLGGMDELNRWEPPLALAIAIGAPFSRKSVYQQIDNDKIYYPNVIEPDFTMADSISFRIGEGNIIQGGCFVSCDVVLGSFNILNGSVVVGHDSEIGNYNVIMPNIRISGEVSIGNDNLFGVGSIVLQQLTVGNGVVLAAGAVLMNSPKDGCTYIGNPARRFKY